MNDLKIAAVQARKITFGGIDWAMDSGKPQRLTCPICSTMHMFSVRAPKRCRSCKRKFNYTAATCSDDF